MSDDHEYGTSASLMEMRGERQVTIVSLKKW